MFCQGKRFWEDKVKDYLEQQAVESRRAMVTDDCRAIIYTILLRLHYIIKPLAAALHSYIPPIHY